MLMGSTFTRWEDEGDHDDIIVSTDSKHANNKHAHKEERLLRGLCREYLSWVALGENYNVTIAK